MVCWLRSWRLQSHQLHYPCLLLCAFIALSICHCHVILLFDWMTWSFELNCDFITFIWIYANFRIPLTVTESDALWDCFTTSFYVGGIFLCCGLDSPWRVHRELRVCWSLLDRHMWAFHDFFPSSILILPTLAWDPTLFRKWPYLQECFSNCFFLGFSNQGNLVEFYLGNLFTLLPKW